MHILFEHKDHTQRDGLWKILWMDRHSVVVEDVSCESHEIRELKCIFEFQNNYQLYINRELGLK